MIAALGYLSVLIGARTVPTGINDVHCIVTAAVLVAGAATSAWLGRPMLALIGLLASLGIIAVDNLASALAVGMAFWLWFRRFWAGAPMLAAFATLLWLREVTRWPDVLLGWICKPIELVPAVAEASLNPTAIGAWPILGAVLLASVRSDQRVRRRWPLMALVVMGAGYAVWRATTVDQVAAGEDAIEMFAPLWWLAIGLSVPVSLSAGAPSGVTTAHSPVWRPLSVAAGLAFLPLLSWLLPASSTAPRVVFLNEGGLDWHLPSRGARVGVEFGMFGGLPYYLEEDGMSVAAVSFDELMDKGLDECDVLVTINNPRVWADDEVQRVDGFLRRGGSLLVLGDHTDVFGCKKGFDSLLTPYGIGFRFDSAYFVRNSWTGAAYETVNPAFARGQGPLVLGHGIGASLAIDAGVENLIVARYGFSDTGVRANEMGAYLGNYHYQVGELAGDLSLVAWKAVGRGRIVAYGDTSAFQSGGLPHTYRPHVLPLMQWLGTRAGIAEQSWYRLLISIVAILSVLGVLRGQKLPALLIGSAALGSVLAGALAHRIDPADAVLSDRILIDDSLDPWTGHYDAQMNSTGPLYTNMSRSGLKGIAGDQSVDLDQDPRGVVMIAPTRRIGDHEALRLLEYVSNGGSLLVAAGLESRTALLPLLTSLGLDIGSTPLGTVPGSGASVVEQLEPRTRNAWPLYVDARASGIVRELFRFGPHVLALSMQIGSGRLVWIGDGQFFSGRNVETSRHVWPGNVRFIENVFALAFGSDAGDVPERFPSPEKPQ
ncbi:MAG: hypothetical protein ACE37K_17030 [Planctomycetota bacterium]